MDSCPYYREDGVILPTHPYILKICGRISSCRMVAQPQPTEVDSTLMWHFFHIGLYLSWWFLGDRSKILSFAWPLVELVEIFLVVVNLKISTRWTVSPRFINSTILDLQRRIYVSTRLRCPSVFADVQRDFRIRIIDVGGFRKFFAYLMAIFLKSMCYKLHTSFTCWCFLPSWSWPPRNR